MADVEGGSKLLKCSRLELIGAYFWSNSKAMRSLKLKEKNVRKYDEGLIFKKWDDN